MNCKVTEEHLNLFLDGELEPTDAERVSAHLRDCDRCSDYLESIARVRDVLRGLPRARAADRFSETVGKRISAAEPDTGSSDRESETIIYPGRLRRFSSVLAAACVLFVACAFAILYLVGDRGQGPDLKTAQHARSVPEIAAADSPEIDRTGFYAGRKSGGSNDRVEIDIETDNLADFDREISLYLASLNAEEIKAGPIAFGGGAGDWFEKENDLGRPEEPEIRLRGDGSVIREVAAPEKPADPGKADSKSRDTVKEDLEAQDKLQFEGAGEKKDEGARREREKRAAKQGVNEELAVDGESKGFPGSAAMDSPVGAGRFPAGFGELRSTLAAAVTNGAEVKYSRITCGGDKNMIAGFSGEAKVDESKKPADIAPSVTDEKAVDKTLEIAESIEKDADVPESGLPAEETDDAERDNKAGVESRTGKRGVPGGESVPLAEDTTEGEADAGEEREPLADKENTRKEDRERHSAGEDEENLPRPLERSLKKKESRYSVRAPSEITYKIVVGDRTFIITVREKAPAGLPAEVESE